VLLTNKLETFFGYKYISLFATWAAQTAKEKSTKNNN